MEWITYMPAILLGIIVVSYIAFLWIQGIDTMNTIYPDYKGEDFLNWESSETIVQFPKKEIKNVKVKVKSVVKKKL